MKRKLVISVVLFIVIVSTSFIVWILPTQQKYDSNVAGVIDGIIITNEEVALAKKEYMIYRPNGIQTKVIDEGKMKKDFNVYMAQKKGLPLNEDFLIKVARQKVIEKLIEENNIILTQEEVDNANTYVDETMKLICEAPQDEGEEERKGRLQFIKSLEEIAELHGMTIEQYNEQQKKSWEFSYKISKLIKNKFKSKDEFEKYLSKNVNRELKIINLNID